MDVAALSLEVGTLKGQIADLTERLLRAHADLDNLRKRNEKDRADTAKYAITKFAQDVITVGDTFQRAIAAVPADSPERDGPLKVFVDGVVLAERDFLNALERHGIRRIDPAGQPFNPHQHHAAAEEQVADVPSGTVTKVYQLGYMIEDRVLRPAMVVVARGGPKPTKSDAPAAAADQPDTPDESATSADGGTADTGSPT
jgi:molecular chaperone GrpE